jgi:hypothetical protein
MDETMPADLDQLRELVTALRATGGTFLPDRRDLAIGVTRPA